VLGTVFCSVIGLVLVPHLQARFQTGPDYSKVSQEKIDELTKQAATLGMSKDLQDYYLDASAIATLKTDAKTTERLRKNDRVIHVTALIDNNAALGVKLCKSGQTDLAKQLFVTIAGVDKDFVMASILLAHLPQRCIPEGPDLRAPVKPLPPLSNSAVR
jgi:hypothetical protein